MGHGTWTRFGSFTGNDAITGNGAETAHLSLVLGRPDAADDHLVDIVDVLYRLRQLTHQEHDHHRDEHHRDAVLVA